VKRHVLSDRTVRTARPGRHVDGQGLLLAVKPSGARSWVFRWQRGGKSREIGLGAYPAVSLARARERAAQARADLAEGRDPLEARRAREAPPETFGSVAAALIRKRRRGWSRAHARQFVRTLRKHAKPLLAKPIAEIEAADVLAVLSKLWDTQPAIGKRLQSFLEQILAAAAAQGARTGPNPAAWRGNLALWLSPPSKVRAVRHHPAMPWREVPAFYASLGDSMQEQALRLVILAAVRCSEATGATWSEIDTEARLWTIPRERMKASRELRVPLAAPALDLLASLPRTSNEFVFWGRRYARPIDRTTVSALMRGSGCTVHGFRSTFRDWAADTGADPILAEMALGHAVGGAVERAYRRTDLLEQRRRLMDKWARHVTGAQTAHVVVGNFGSA